MFLYEIDLNQVMTHIGGIICLFCHKHDLIIPPFQANVLDVSAIVRFPGLSIPARAAGISRNDAAFRSYDREAAMYVQASRLKIAARVSMSPRFELPAAKEIWQPFV